MANENNIQLDLTINEKSIDSAWLPVEKAATKSAKDSAAAFEAAFKGVAHSSAEEFKAAFEAQSKNRNLIPKETTFKAINSLTDVASALYLVKQAFDVLKSAASATLDVILEGDKIVKTERRFEAFATQAGLTAGVLQNELKNAVKGLVDDTEVLDLASEAFVRLGSNAKNLPQVLEAARRTYAVFGGSITENARRIINAAETGSARSLRDIGLYIDLEGALKKYAKTLGTVPALLTAQQKEQGRLAAILAEAETRLGNVQVQAGATTSYTQLKVALNELNDEFSKLTNSKLGGIFQTLADYAKIVVTNIGDGLKRIRPAETLGEISTKLETLKLKAQDYEKQLVALGTGSATLAFKANLQGQLVLLKAQIEDYKELIRVKGVNASVTQKTPADAAADEERLKRRREVLAKSLELSKSTLASEIALDQQAFAAQASNANLDKLYKAQKLQTLQEYEIQKAALLKFYADNATATAAEQAKGEDDLRVAYQNKALIDQMKYEEQKRAINALAAAQFSIDVQSAGEGISATMAGVATAMLTQFKSIKAGLTDLGKSFVTSFKTQMTGAIIAFAQGTKTASEALHDFFNGLLNAFAEMLVSQGLGFILQGAALSWLGDPRGAGLIQAGAAMVAFGAGLAAVTGANGGAVGATGAGGGAAGTTEATTGTTSDTSKPIVETKPDTPRASINVNVGQVFDRRETGLWIADILTERFEQDGITVRSNV